MFSLDYYAHQHGTDKVNPHDYMKRYDAHLPPGARPVRLLEIGVLFGASMKTWASYYTDPSSRFVGVDIDPRCKQLDFRDERISIIIEDVKTAVIDGNFDVIIDDGSHLDTDIREAFLRLWPKVKPGGWYVIEDLDVQDSVKSVALATLWALVRRLMHKQGDVEEMHLYDELWFLKKRQK